MQVHIHYSCAGARYQIPNTWHAVWHMAKEMAHSVKHANGHCSHCEAYPLLNIKNQCLGISDVAGEHIRGRFSSIKHRSGAPQPTLVATTATGVATGEGPSTPGRGICISHYHNGLDKSVHIPVAVPYLDARTLDFHGP